MKIKIPCEIIRDLLPSYIEKLTSDVTNKAIKEHLADCKDCKRVYGDMTKFSDLESENDDAPKIDYLKKTKKRSTRKTITCVIVALVIATTIFTGLFKFASKNAPRNFRNSVEYENFTVYGNAVDITVKTINEYYRMKSLEITENNGIVLIDAYVQSLDFLTKDKISRQETFNNPIKEIYLNSDLIWKNGFEINGVTRELYNLRTPYVGGVGGTDRYKLALNTMRFGSCYNKLQTREEPYGWTLVFEDEQAMENETFLTDAFRAYGCALLAIVDNLGYMNFEYINLKEEKTFSITKEEASEFVGENIKNFSSDIIKLQELVNKIDLTNFTVVDNRSFLLEFGYEADFIDGLSASMIDHMADTIKEEQKDSFNITDFEHLLSLGYTEEFLNSVPPSIHSALIRNIDTDKNKVSKVIESKEYWPENNPENAKAVFTTVTAELRDYKNNSVKGQTVCVYWEWLKAPVVRDEDKLTVKWNNEYFCLGGDSTYGHSLFKDSDLDSWSVLFTHTGLASINQDSFYTYFDLANSKTDLGGVQVFNLLSKSPIDGEAEYDGSLDITYTHDAVPEKAIIIAVILSAATVIIVVAIRRKKKKH